MGSLNMKTDPVRRNLTIANDLNYNDGYFLSLDAGVWRCSLYQTPSTAEGTKSGPSSKVKRMLSNAVRYDLKVPH